MLHIPLESKYDALAPVQVRISLLIYSLLMQEIRFESIPKRNENVSWKEFGTDGILLNLVTGDYFDVNETGLLIWDQADGRKTVNGIAEEVAARFAVRTEDLARDVIEFLQELAGKGLVSVEP